MILFRYKWRWDKSEYRIVPNIYWKVYQDLFCDYKINYDFFALRRLTLVAKNINDAIALAKIGSLPITETNEVDNFEQVRKQAEREYEKELNNVRNPQPGKKRNLSM